MEEGVLSSRANAEWAEAVQRRRQGRPRMLQRRTRTSAERQVSDDMRKPRKKMSKDVVHVSARLTPGMQRKLFEGYPGLYELYKEHVPGNMTTKEFWTRFLRSKVLHDRKMYPPGGGGTRYTGGGETSEGRN